MVRRGRHVGGTEGINKSRPMAWISEVGLYWVLTLGFFV